MKSIYCLFITLIFSTGAFAQDISSLQQRAQKLYLHTVENKGDSIVKYAHPSVFKKITRKELINYYNKSGKVEGYNFSLLNIPPQF